MYLIYVPLMFEIIRGAYYYYTDEQWEDYRGRRSFKSSKFNCFKITAIKRATWQIGLTVTAPSWG